MAASKGSLGAQITAAIFALVSIICGFMWYKTNDELTQAAKTSTAATADLGKEKGITTQLLKDIDEMKRVVGATQNTVGTAEQGGAETVVGDVQASVAAAVAEGAQARTMKESVSALIQERSNMVKQLATMTTSLADEKKSFDDRVTNLNKDLDAAKADKELAVKAKEDAIKSKSEEVKSKQATIDKLNKDLQNLNNEFSDAKTAWDNERKRVEGEVAQYNDQIDRLRERLKSLTKESFEVPDGFVTWVDNSTRTVSINLGSADGLRPRVSFSVYRKEHNGVGRGPEDIKAQIEVIKITGAHSAEAKVRGDDPFQPLAKGDPIYTPLWSPGIREKFVIVGLVDLDKDGISDRERFHDIIASAGGQVTQEVLDSGARIRFTNFPSEWSEWAENDPQVGSDVKYLIIADIPDPSLAVRPEDKEVRSNIANQLKAMKDEARRVGVEEITLGNFLSYIGYKPERQLYVPGGDRPFTLKNGAASTTTGEAVGDRSSAGQTSKIYGDRSQRLKPQRDMSGKR